MSYALEVQVIGEDRARASLNRLIMGLREPAGLYAEIAGEAELLTQEYLRGLNRHRTANRLGAPPTYHYEQASRRVEGHSDDEQAVVRIPRNTGLGRAFGPLTIRPKRADIRFLTIPNHRLTYGKRVGEFAPDTFRFVVFGGRHRALVFDGGAYDGEIGYWLKESVRISQDRTLLPSDDDFTAAAVGAARRYVRRLIGEEEGGQA